MNEQTIGFQGRHADKLRITFKKIGDGFMCDAICECGYTYSFIFRNDKVPDIIHDLSNTSKRVLHLIQEVPNDWINVYMDNLFNSVKLCEAAWIEKAKVHGVVRKSGRGIPTEVTQIEVKAKRKQAEVRGTVKVAI